ncbi:SusE domain-containing protein [Flavobacterium caeni]|uniref:SusE outer membrane protein n=1 Tax=Flavobacterium caeni TaxID=490189 RepID=A0A1G5GH55_9FLAO|nr:SusE domain-containing protein [Flavobacterium caeni]SCY50906.1 SusE outer membrane protein [Flavobacterium caeni]
MKKIVKLSALFLMVAATFSCEEDEIPNGAMITPQNGPVIIAPDAGTNVVLSPENMDNLGLTLAWTDAAYSTATPITYNVEFAAAGTDFAEPFEVASTTNRSVSWTVEQLNSIAINPDGLALLPYTEQDVDVRIISVVGNAGEPIASNSITLTITPYTTDNPTLAVPGNHQGWSPSTAPLIASSGFGETDYEGYMWLDGGFKFLSPQADGTFDWGTQDWGDDGSFAGVLADGGSETDAIATPGYYYVKADTEALSYSTQTVNWGVIGNGTPTGWDSDTDMVYDPATKTLSLDIMLTAGNFFKFRANDGWDLNLGDFQVDKPGAGEVMSYGGADIPTPGSGMYHIVLDLSNPRAYTYTVTAL